MNTAILEEIGLTKTEIKIYLTLLKTGQTTTTTIVRESGIYASKVYEFLDRLIQKGLVTYVVKSNKKYFNASNPQSLKELLREKRAKLRNQEKQVEKMLPELKALKKSRKDEIHSDIYEGLPGLKSIYEKILSTLRKGQTQFIIGAPRIGNELIEGFLLDWHKRRVKKGIKCRYIYDSDARDYGKIREKMRFTEVKYLPKNMRSSTWIEIFGDNVMIGHIKGRNGIFFLIKDKAIARGYLDYFRIIWASSHT